jgi:hypothetical protein
MSTKTIVHRTAAAKRRNLPQPDINEEIRQLQRTAALVRCMQVAAAEETKVDLGDALDVICDRVDESLRKLDVLDSLKSSRADNSYREGRRNGRR